MMTIPLISSLFAASAAIWWSRFRVKRLFNRFMLLETSKGHSATPHVIEGSQQAVIKQTATAAAVGSMALTTTYLTFYTMVPRIWYGTPEKLTMSPCLTITFQVSALHRPDE